MQISQSDVVRVRRARWRVVNVRAGESCQVLTLAGVGLDNAGVERRFLTPFDVVERVERRSTPARVPRRLWRRACRAVIAAEIPPGALGCPRLARIDLLPHQLEPALALVRGLGSRVLLADEVGLGKTIQAGLIVSELRTLGAADRVLIVTPAGLRDQWARELAERFAIDAAVLDVRTLRRSMGSLPLGVNPWQTVPVAIVSVDYLKRADVLAAAAACLWDVLVVDEAHNVSGASDRHAAVAALAGRAAYVVLVTATPHSGDRGTFTSLCNLGARGNDRLLVFRRSRKDVRAGTTRRVHRIHVQMNQNEVRMHALLAQYLGAIRRQYEKSHAGSDYWLALAVLQKRAVSSARSLQQSIHRRLAMLGAEEEPSAHQLQLPLGDLAGELTTADEPPGWSPLLTLEDTAYERRLLNALADAAARAARHETKIAALARLLRRVREPAIVFTEYRDTLMHLQASLGLPALLLHGGLTRDERVAVVDRFTRGLGRLLLATDAAAEGLNLQQTCRLVVNLELPWNPMRLEQRVGRVDRIGQQRTVHVFHLIARDSGELEVLSRLQSRVAAARADVGGPDPLGVPLGVGSDDDGVIARLILTGEAPPDLLQIVPVEDTRLSEPLWMPSLELEAQAEAARIGRARALTKAGDDQAAARLEGLGPLVASARHWLTRARLGNRALMLWQIAAEDGLGRVVGSMVVAVAVNWNVWKLGWNRRADEEVRSRVEQAAEAWRERIAAAHEAFISTRLVRERGIDAPGPKGPGLRRSADVFQPGLFERREERARLALAASQNAADGDRADRLAAVERSRAVSFLPPQLLLILTP